MILLNNALSKEIASRASFDEALDIIKLLETELRNSTIPGIGLAAPQIGIDKAVAIVRIPDPYHDSIISVTLVNPRLKDAHNIITFDEGCLSFPAQSTKTVRFDEIVIDNDIDDYEMYAALLNAKRYGRSLDTSLMHYTNNKRTLQFCSIKTDPLHIQNIQQLTSVCVQHEYAHLLGLTMFDFAPQEIGRNDLCPCNSGKKNKKCHQYEHFNTNLITLFNPKYKGE